MKKCPLCKMTVKADMVCPICQNTLTYEPEIVGRFEKKVFNKFLFSYLFKRFAFVILAIAFCVISGLFIQQKLFWQYLMLTAPIAFLAATLQRTLTMYIKNRFFEGIVWFLIICAKYLSLILPIAWGILYLIFN